MIRVTFEEDTQCYHFMVFGVSENENEAIGGFSRQKGVFGKVRLVSCSTSGLS